MRISQSEHKMVVDERNKLRKVNARLIEIIRYHAVCMNCEHHETPSCPECNVNPCGFQLKPIEKKPCPKCEKCGEPVHPMVPCEEAKLLRGE